MSQPPRALAAEAAEGVSPEAFRPLRVTAIADSLWTAGAVEACWQWLDGRIGAARAAGDSTLLIELLSRRGSWRARLGQVAEAEPDLQEAIAAADRRRLEQPVRQCLRWRGFALYRLGRTGEAAECWERLLLLSRAANDEEHEAWAFTGLALQHEEAGRAQRAGEEYGRALALFRACGAERGAAYAGNGLGTALQGQGRYDEAIEEYQRAAETARRLRWTWLQATATNNIAVLSFSLGDPGKAQALFREAVRLHQAAGDVAEEALAGMNAAICEAALGRFEEAAAELERIRNASRRRGIVQEDGHLCNALAGIRHEQGRDHLAARLHRETLAAKPPAPAQARVEALVALSSELAAMDSVSAAWRELQQAAPWVHKLEDPRLRVAYEIERGRRCLDAGRVEEADSLLAAAAREAERLGVGSLRLPALAAAARAAQLQDRPDSALILLAAATRCWEMERALPVDLEWREVRGASAVEIRNALGSLLLEYPPDRAETERTRAAFDAVQGFKARTLLERVGGPAGAASDPTLRPVTCSRLQSEVLLPGELLLDFHLGADTSIVFAVTRAECRAVHLPGSRTLADPLALHLRMISAPASTPSVRERRARSGGEGAARESDLLAETRRRLRGLLLGQVEDLIAANRSLIISPDGILQRVSFPALLEGGALKAVESSADGLSAIQSIPSPTILASLRSRIREGRAPREQGATVLALAGGAGIGGERLAGAQGEVRDLARRFRHVRPGSSLYPRLPSPDSSRASSAGLALLQEITRYDLLHFAAHATIENERPWRSRIHLGPGDPPGREISLTAADIAKARLNARLAVLASCRSADGRVLLGEGVQGLAGAFLVAGAPAVVAALWPVDDEGTRAFMRRFYGHLADGLTAAAALKQAQADARADPRTRAPCYWAGFVVVGDGELRVALERRSRLGQLAGPLALVLLGVAAILSAPITRYARSRS